MSFSYQFYAADQVLSTLANIFTSEMTYYVSLTVYETQFKGN